MEPKAGEKILILKQPWLQMILSGQKTLEIRGRALSPGKYWLGQGSMIHGVVYLGTAFWIDSLQSWTDHYSQHRVDLPMLPYKKTYALPILSARPTGRMIPYIHPKGAIGIVKFRQR